MELREKIAAIVEPLLDGPRGTSDADYEADQRAIEVADRILAIPEIAEALYCDCGAERCIGACTGHCDNDE